MSDPGREWLERLLSRARRRHLLGGLLDALAGALVTGAAGAALAHPGAGGVAVAAVCGALAGAGARWAVGWRWPRVVDLARHLDAGVAAAEWSAELLVARPETLPLLARLQRERIVRLVAEWGEPALPRRTWSGPLLRALAAAALAAVWLAVLRPGAVGGRPTAAVPAAAPIAPIASAAIKAVRVEVDPPRYTGLPPHFVDGWRVRAEEGARVAFRIELAGAADRAVLRFGEEDQALARGADGAWRTERRGRQSELYALRVFARGREVLRGPLARLEVVRDQPPVLEVLHPAPLTLVSSAAPGTLDLEVAAHDDYAVAGVEAQLVLARGRGEQVRFRELKRSLLPRPGGRFAARLDLAALGLAADVEIFLRFEARDNREPEPGRTRSATLRIRMPTAEERPSAALAAGIALPAALAMFRSERQIILDTERLLRDQPHLGAAELQRRAQDIGFDQHALRLRYGALLGEEVESGLAVEAAEAEVAAARAARDSAGGAAASTPAPGSAAAPSANAHPGAGGGGSAADLAARLPAGMVHMHDSAESATFLPEALRREMREILAAMWDAEGRLRGVDPRGALPFEERALRQLKDVQQRSRVYVAKVGSEAPEVDPARRLTGDLAAVRGQRAALAAPGSDPLRMAFAWAESACGATSAPLLAPGVRGAAEQALERAALAGDDEALRALAAWRAAVHPGCREAQAVGAALWRLLPPPPPPIARAAGER
ncbi:MAG TPA: hypothetical protein VHR45_20595 [Thermoanaerobaculia bacterium]|nr:hypothetical protein [Thermoanaerobaculia bacterium]